MRAPLRPAVLSIRQLLLLITGALTLMIAALAVGEVWAEANRIARLYALRDASALSDQLFDATDKLSLERDLALSMLTTEDAETLAELRPRLIVSRHDADTALNVAESALARYTYPELARLRASLSVRRESIRGLRLRIDSAIALPLRQRDQAVAARWSTEAEGIVAETENLWIEFIRHYANIDAIVTQHLRFKHFLRTITDYTGRQRSIIGQIISENTDPTLEQTSQLLRAEGEIEVSWRMSRILADQSGLYPSIASAYTDAESHYSVMQGMSHEMFYVPGARHGAAYLIGPDLWFELSSQAAESLGALRTASISATRAYLDHLIGDTQKAIAGQIAIFMFALLLCGYSFWIVITHVIRPINRIVAALLAATRGEPVDFPATIRRQDEIGKLGGVLQAFQDNLEQIRRTAADLDRSETRLRAVVDHAVDGLITLDAEGAIVGFNPACERIFGYSAQAILSRPIWLLMPALRSGDQAEELSAYVAGIEAQLKGATGHEVIARRQDGSFFPADVTMSAFTLEGVTYYSGIIRDITSRKEAEQTVLSYTHALERSNKELDDFAYIASHDLKEPLRGIHNHARFLLEDNAEKLDKESGDRLHRLIYLSQRMEKLVNDLLYFSRLGRQELAIQPTDLNATIADIENRLAHFFEDNHAKIILPQPMPIITCDGPRVSELFHNLITNAVKYNDNTEKTVEIGFLQSARKADGAVMQNVFYVKDDGSGIDPEFHLEVFRIFKRLKSGAVEGTGVGLTFVKKIIERHGGEIWIESELGKGATFFFTLEEYRDDAKASARAA